MSLQVLHDVACPYCGAGIGKSCRRSPSGRLIPSFHVARRQAFRTARAAEELRRSRPVDPVKSRP